MTLRRLLRNPTGLVGALLILAILVCAIFAPHLAPHDPDRQNLMRRNRPPAWVANGTWEHPLGTDQLGRDLLSRIIYGARVSVLVGLSTVMIQMVLGVAIGLAAGYYRGWFETISMRFGDVWLVIPFLILAMSIMVVLGPGLLNTIIVLGVTGWVTFARIVRAEVLSVRERDFVTASISLGAGNLRILWTHILPNVTAPIIVAASLQVSRMIIAEASLSFLGLGVQPPTAAWGSMIAMGRDYIFNQWWLATMPGLAIFITTLGINLLGDALRDVLDPTLRGRA